MIELSNELLRDLIVAALTLSGECSALPFEVSIPVAGEKSAAPTGPVCLRISDVQIDLQTSHPMSVQLSFDNGSAKTPWGDLDGLDGCIEIPVYFPYVLTKNGKAHIALDLSGAEPWRIAFSEGSKERAKFLLQDAYQGVEEIWQETLAAFIQKQPLLLSATGLTVTASEGGLSPLRFYNIEAQGFGPAQDSGPPKKTDRRWAFSGPCSSRIHTMGRRASRRRAHYRPRGGSLCRFLPVSSASLSFARASLRQ